MDSEPTPCPICGNRRVVRVTRFLEGEPTLVRGVCVGDAGCDAWFDPATRTIVRKGWDDLPRRGAPADHRRAGGAGSG